MLKSGAEKLCKGDTEVGGHEGAVLTSKNKGEQEGLLFDVR